MSYNVIPTPDFKKLFKKLAKKYPSIKTDLQQLIDRLTVDPTTGVHLGHNLYKYVWQFRQKAKVSPVVQG